MHIYVFVFNLSLSLKEIQVFIQFGARKIALQLITPGITHAFSWPWNDCTKAESERSANSSNEGCQGKEPRRLQPSADTHPLCHSLRSLRSSTSSYVQHQRPLPSSVYHHHSLTHSQTNPPTHTLTRSAHFCFVSCIGVLRCSCSCLHLVTTVYVVVRRHLLLITTPASVRELERRPCGLEVRQASQWTRAACARDAPPLLRREIIGEQNVLITAEIADNKCKCIRLHATVTVQHLYSNCRQSLYS